MKSHPSSLTGLIRLAAIVSFVFSLAYIAIVPSPANSQTPAPQTYEENFDTGAARGWQLEAGWMVRDGRLEGSGHTWARYTDWAWSPDPWFSLRFRLVELNGGLHINTFVSDTQRYILGLRHQGNGRLTAYLTKQVGPNDYRESLVEGERQPAVYGALPQYTVFVMMRGGTIRVSTAVPGEEFGPTLLEYTDPDPLPSGIVAFETLEGSAALIDDLHIVGFPVALPTPAPEAPPGGGSWGLAPKFMTCPTGLDRYREQFDTGQLPGWELEPGWDVENGQFVGRGYAWASYTSGSWMEGPMILRFILADLSAGGGVHANIRVSDTGRYAIGFRHDPPGSLYVYLFKEYWPNVSPHLASGRVSYLQGRQYDIEISYENGQIVVQILKAGQREMLSPETIVLPALDYFDDNPVPPGTIAFESLEDTAAIIDDVVVCGIPASVVPPTAVPPTIPPPTAVPPTILPPTAVPPTIPPPTAVPPTIPPPTAVPPTIPPPPPLSDSSGFTFLIIIFIGAVILIASLLGVVRAWKGGNGSQKRAPPLPLPPMRLIRIWLTEGAGGDGRMLTDAESLVTGSIYSLHVRIEPRGNWTGGQEQSRSPATISPAEVLEVVLFAPEEDFALPQRTAQITIGPDGPSSMVTPPITPLRSGQRRIRVCVYYRNVLLQSAVLDASVIERNIRDRRGAITRTIDYVSSWTMARLHALPRPVLSIFTNKTVDGAHWIGVFSSDAAAGQRLRLGDLHTFREGELAALAQSTRELLTRLEVEGRDRYRYSSPPPLDDNQLRQLETDLRRLAIQGWIQFHKLFLGRDDRFGVERLRELREALTRPGLISIARCHDEAPTIPWATLYDLPLDNESGAEIRLCPIARARLANNVWSADGTTLVNQHDLLDDPVQCRSLRHCPLNGEARKFTICPFGFWGILHQVEQPLGQITPTPADEIPSELTGNRYEAGMVLLRKSSEPVRIVVAINPNLPIAASHEAELQSLSSADPPVVVFARDRNQALALLERGGHHVFYFFCHGETSNGRFRLKLGKTGESAYLSAAALDPTEIVWPSEPHSLFILNGCATMAFTPETIHEFLGTLRKLGASGIIGSEIPVHTMLARPFGLMLLRRLLNGSSLGEAFLAIRRDLLRRGNPLGLAYAAYAPAGLHLHRSDHCVWCQLHGITMVDAAKAVLTVR